MTFHTNILDLHKQLAFLPEIQNKKALKRTKKFIVCGMGGSHLSADLLLTWRPSLDLIVWSDYGLPPLSDKALKERLIIVSSYSGNTEEALDSFQAARRKKLSVAVIASGGKLLELAKKFRVPYIQFPEPKLQPRLSAGYGIAALLAFMGEGKALKELHAFSREFRAVGYEKRGEALAKKLSRKVPIVYASAKNRAVGYTWKVNFNESGKIPAFTNIFPELNHNEMTGYDVKRSTWELSENHHFIFIRDNADEKHIKKRMALTEKMYKSRGFKVEAISLYGRTAFHKIFSSLAFAAWTAYYLAKNYGLDPEQVPMVEEFKKRMK